MNSKSSGKPSQLNTKLTQSNKYKAIKKSQQSLRRLSSSPFNQAPNSPNSQDYYDSNVTQSSRMQAKGQDTNAVPPWMPQPPSSNTMGFDLNSPLNAAQSSYSSPSNQQQYHAQKPAHSSYSDQDISFLQQRVKEQRERMGELDHMDQNLKMDLNDIKSGVNNDPSINDEMRDDFLKYANRLKTYEESYQPNAPRTTLDNKNLNAHNRVLNQHNLPHSEQSKQTSTQNNKSQRSLSNSQFTYSDINPQSNSTNKTQDLQNHQKDQQQTHQSSPKPPKTPKTSLFHRFRRISPIIDQFPAQARHVFRLAKHVKSPETLELLRAQIKQSTSLLFSDHNIKRTKMEFKDRLNFLDEYVDRKMREPYIDPTTEYRLQRKEILHDRIIDAHYARDRFVDKFRAKMNVFSKTFDAVNHDPRKREILARKIFFTALDNDTSINKMLRIMYFPFGLILRSIGSLLNGVLFSIEIVTSKLFPEISIICRTLRGSLSDKILTPNNILQLMGLTALATFFATIGYDFITMYAESLTTPRGMFVDVAHAFLFVNSEEMLYDSVRELVANRLLITPDSYREMYDKYSKLDSHVPDWGTSNRQSQQISLIQPIFTKMKSHLIDIYKSRFFLPFEKFGDSLRDHQLSMGFTIEALDGFLDAMYMRDTRTKPDLATDYSSTHQRIVNYLISQDFLVLPPADVIRTNAPNEIFHQVVQNYRTLEGKDPMLGGELFKDYLQIGSRLAYRKKLLSELEQLSEMRKLLENARFANVTIPPRDIKKIACDLGDPITRSVQSHLEELRIADPVTPLYPNRTARQLLESTYQIDARHTHYSLDTTVVNDHYLLLCNMDNPRYSYDTLCNRHYLQFRDTEQRDTFERHIYHLGLVLNKIDAIMVQDYIELRRVEGQLITPLNPLQTNNILGLIASDKDLKNLKLPTFDSQFNSSVIIPAPPEAQLTAEGHQDLNAIVDNVEYQQKHYKSLIHARKEELKFKMDQSHPADSSWKNYLTDWWHGKQTSENPYSKELDTILGWQATRDVMNEIGNDPHLHSRFMSDYAQDRLSELHQHGYLKKPITLHQLPFDPNSIPNIVGEHKPSTLSPGYEDLPSIQRLFSPRPISQHAVPPEALMGQVKMRMPPNHTDPYMSHAPSQPPQNS